MLLDLSTNNHELDEADKRKTAARGGGDKPKAKGKGRKERWRADGKVCSPSHSSSSSASPTKPSSSSSSSLSSSYAAGVKRASAHGSRPSSSSPMTSGHYLSHQRRRESALARSRRVVKLLKAWRSWTLVTTLIRTRGSGSGSGKHTPRGGKNACDARAGSSSKDRHTRDDAGDGDEQEELRVQAQVRYTRKQ